MTGPDDPDGHHWIYDLAPGEGDAARLVDVAERLAARGDVGPAATAYDRAFALDPSVETVTEARASVLAALAVEEHGLRFRYVPAGTYVMGSDEGDPDERPVHRVRLGAFWLGEAPVSWSAYCELMGWEPPPVGFPPEGQGPAKSDDGFDSAAFMLYEANKIRLQYCEDGGLEAADWHSHAGAMEEIFRPPPRDDPDAPVTYAAKAMVSVAWQEIEQLADRLAGTAAGPGTVTYRLPTEAEWEAAARGGLAGCRYPWGDEPPTFERCDFGSFDDFVLQRWRRFPPNGYGLFAMSGGVWEWTADRYDADFYAESPPTDPTGPAGGRERVLRGGSWADCPEVVTVSFRASRDATPWWDGEWGDHFTPTIGFRLCRVEA